MVDRGFSTPALTALADDSIEYYYLFKIDFASADIVETTAPFSIAYGGDTYLPEGLVLEPPTINETLEIKPATVPLVMSGASALLHALTLTENYRNAPVFIYIYEASTATVTQIFKGYIDSYASTDDVSKGTSKITWACANHWKNWEATEGRFISYANQLSLFPGDLGLQFANRSPKLAWWGGGSDAQWTNSSYNAAQAAKDPLGAFGMFSSFQNSPYILGTLMNKSDAGMQAAEVIGAELKHRLPVVYGQQRVEGLPAFIGISGGSNEYLSVLYLLAEGECTSLENIWFGDNDYSDSRISPVIRVTASNFHTGSDTQTVDTDLEAAFVQWTSAHRLRGICYCVVRYYYNEDIWANGMPEPIFEIKGKKLLDVRTPENPIAYSTSPALVLYDYLTNTTYGKSLTDADLVDFEAATTYGLTQKTDHNEAISGAGSAGTISLFSFEGTIKTSVSIRKNVEKILFTMRARLPFINGQYSLVIERDDDVGTITIDESDLTGSFDVSEGGISDVANHVTYEYVDAEAGHQVEQVVVESATYLGIDNNRVLKKSYSNMYESNRYRAEQRAETQMKASRQQLRVKCSLFNFGMIKLVPGIIVNLDNTLRGWNQKPFRVEELSLTKDGTIKASLREYESEVFDWAVSVEKIPPENTDITDPLLVDPPTNLELSSGTSDLVKNADGSIMSRIHVTFVAPATVLISGYIVYVHKAGESEILYKAINDISITDLYVESVEDGVVYAIAVTAVNSLGIESDRVQAVETVEGKTALPINPITVIDTGSIDLNVVNLKWTPENAEIDFSHYEVWGSSVDNVESAGLIATSFGNIFNHGISSTYYYWIKCVDTTKNKSTFFPAGTNGQEGIPDGSGGVDWDTLAGKPADSDIFNTVNFANYFETDDFDLWQAPVNNTITTSTDHYSGNHAGLMTSSIVTPAANGDGCIYILIPENIALAFAGKKIRIIVYAKKPAANASPSFQMLYTTWGDGHSGWSESFVPPANSGNFATFGLYVNVPENDSGTTSDRLYIWADTTGSGDGVLIDNVVIDILASWVDVKGDQDAPADNADVTLYDDYRVSNSSEDDNVLTIANPLGGRFHGGANETGAIVITLPQSWTSTMMKFVVDVFLYKNEAAPLSNKSFSMAVGGYTFPTAWQREFAQISGNTDSNNKVRWGHDGSNCVVVIGDEDSLWEYPTITVESFQASFDNFTLDQWKSGWNVDVELIESHATKTFTFSGELTDALLDAREVLGQGALALKDDADYVNDVIGGPPVNADATDYTSYKISNSDERDDLLTISHPSGARYSTVAPAGSATGSIVIFLPQPWTNTMIKFVVDVYLHKTDGTTSKSTTFSLAVGGYTDNNTNNWNNPFAQLSGSAAANNQVRFGYDAVTDKCVVVIGSDTDFWDLPQIDVRDFQAGYANFALAQWETGWDVQIVSNTTGYSITDTISDALLDAAKILNQGLLAVEDGINYDDVGGTKPSANADVSTASMIGAKINYNSFTNPNAGDAFFHGYDKDGIADNVNPWIAKDGQNLELIKGTLDPNMACEGYIVYNVNSVWASTDKYAIGVPDGAATWSWTVFYNGIANSDTLNGDYVVIGFARTNTSDNTINNVSLWGYGIKANMALDYYADITDYSDYRVSNSSDANSILTIINPRGNDVVGGKVTRYSYLGDVTGGILITLPQGYNSARIKFEMDVFTDDYSFKLQIGGRLNGTWSSTFGQVVGSTLANQRLRFGLKDGKAVIFIGETDTEWNDPKMYIKNFQAGGATGSYDFSDWDDNWDLEVLNTTSGITFVSAAEISDSLIDAASILGQGFLAKEDETNIYGNESYLFHTLFDSSEGMSLGTSTLCWSISHTYGLRLIQYGTSNAWAMKQVLYTARPGTADDWDRVTKFKTSVKLSGMSGAGTVMPRVNAGVTYQAGFSFSWNATDSAIDVSGYTDLNPTVYPMFVKQVANDGSPIELECIVIPDTSVTFIVNGTTIVYSGVGKLLSSHIMKGAIFHAIIPYDGTTGITMDMSEYLLHRDPL